MNHSSQCWSEVFFYHFPKFLLLLLAFAYIYISQGSVETHLLCGGIYNNHIIANSLQSVSVEKCWKLVNNWQRYGQNKVAHFLWPTEYIWGWKSLLTWCCLELVSVHRHFLVLIVSLIVSSSAPEVIQIFCGLLCRVFALFRNNWMTVIERESDVY